MTPVDTRTPKSPRTRSADTTAARTRGRDADELPLAALSAPFPPEPGDGPHLQPLPPRDGVEPEDADDFPGDAPTTVRAPASGVVARSPGFAALLAAPPLLAPPPERALARVALIILPAGPGELLVPLPPVPHGPSMLLIAGLTGGLVAPTGLSARLAPAPAGALAELFELAPIAVDPLDPALARAPGADPGTPSHALDSVPPPALSSAVAGTPAAGFARTGVAPSRETLPPRRRQKPLALAAAALVLVGATGLLARAGLLDGLHVGFDRASSAAIALEQRAQRALSRPVTSMLPSVMPAAPSEPEPTPDDLVERAKRLINAGGQPRLREAQGLLEQAKAADSQNPHAHATLGEVLLQRGAHEAAFTAAAEAVRLRPRRARYRVLLGDVYRALGRADEAEKAYTKAAELDPHGRSVDDVDGASVRALSEL
jgi:Anaphase-promoting complex, cyclosome, subunit 3